MLQATIDFGFGVIMCWFFNLVQLGIAFFLLATSEKTLPFVYVLLTALGLVQIGYIVPIYHLLRRKGKLNAARGLLAAACATAVVNAIVDYHMFGSRIFHLLR